MSLSASDRRVAVSRITDGAVNGNSDLYIVDAQTGSGSRFTFDPGEDSAPVWSPDDSQIVFRGIRNGGQRLLRKRVRGTKGEELLLDNPPGAGAGQRTPTDWSQDGRHILFTQQGVGGASDIWAFPLSGDGQPIAVTQTAEAESLGVFSPNGRWIGRLSIERSRRGADPDLRPALSAYRNQVPGLPEWRATAGLEQRRS